MRNTRRDGCLAYVAVAAWSAVSIPAARADELLGASAVLAAPTPAEFRRAEPAYATFRQGKTFGYHFAVASGSYTLEVGFVELIWRRPEQRRFDVLVNGNIVLPAFDPVAAAGPAPQRIERTFAVTAAADGIRVMFRAANDQAAVAWLRLRAAEGGEVVRFVDCGGDTDLDPPSADAALSEQILPRFGSRALLDLRPQWGDAEATPLGKFTEVPAPLLLGFECDGVVYGLPFAKAMQEVRAFDSVVESRTATTLRYDVTFPGHRGAIVLHAPFDPGDLVTSALPAFRIEFAAQRVDSAAAAKPVTARVTITTPGSTQLRDVEVGGHSGAVGVEPHAAGAVERALFVDAGRVSAAPRRLNGSAPLAADGSATFHLVLLSRRPVVSEGTDEYRVRAALGTSSAESVMAESLARRERSSRASAIFDGLVEDAVMPTAVKDLLRVAIPSFLMNTVDAESASGRRFYSCIEGYCRYHGTLDVEAHTLPFYLWIAPQLVPEILDRAAGTVSSDHVMGHDVGRDATIGAPLYPHAMPIEENTNFVLMLHEYVAFTGDSAVASRHLALAADLLARVRACDADGDGLAETGVANTIDDGSAAVQYARGQTYLATKAAAAHLALADLLPSGDATAATCRDYAARIRETLVARAWRATHFALTPDASAAGLVNPWLAGAAESTPAEVVAASTGDDVLEGADSAHGLAALGALHALRTFSEPPLPLELLATDLVTAAERTRRRFVLAHAEHEVNGWVSLGILRDAASAYLGIDATAHVERYAALQARRNRLDDLADWAGFCDSPFNRYLSYYPRGVVAAALVDALAGLRVDRVAKRIELRPLVAPLRVPLPQFANWRELRVPWLEVVTDGAGNVVARITDEDLLGDCDVTLDLSRVGGGTLALPRTR